MAVTINTVDEYTFSLNGVNHSKIYQPQIQGLTHVSLFNTYDTRFVLLAGTLYSEFTVDSSTYASQALLIDALLSVVYTRAFSGEEVAIQNGVFGFADTPNYKYIPSTFDWTGDLSSYVGSIMEVRYAEDLGGGTVTLPAGVTLNFVGGSFSNGNIIGIDTNIESPKREIFDATDLTLSGSWSYSEFYPEWYGAIGDGTTLNEVAIQATFDNLGDTGGTVYFSKGVYRISVEIAIANQQDIVVKGGGRSSILETTSSTEHILNFSALTTSFPDDLTAIRVTGMGFWGNNDLNSTGQAIRLRSGHENMVDSCHIGEYLHVVGYGIYLSGVVTGDIDNNVISNNSIQRIAQTGIRINGVTLDATAEENIIADNVISYCGLSGGGNGISVTGQRNSITGNTIEESQESGIVIDGGFNTITGNTCCESGSNGIIIFDGNGNTVTGNVCRDNDHFGTGNFSGIFVNTDYNIIANNICYNNIRAGITIAVAGAHNIVQGNQLFWNANQGLEDLSSTTRGGSNFTESTDLSGKRFRIRRQTLPLTINTVSTIGLSTAGWATWNFHQDIVVPTNAIGVKMDVQVQDSGASGTDSWFKFRKGGATGEYVTACRCVPANDRWIEREVSLLFTNVWSGTTGGLTISRAGSLVTVTSTAHGLQTGDIVEVEGADQVRYNGIQKVTYVDANTFTYIMAFSVFSDQNTSPPTGTITWKQRLYQLDYSTQASGAGTLDGNIKIIGWILED